MLFIKVLFVAIIEFMKLSPKNKIIRKYLSNGMLDRALEVAESSTQVFSRRIMEAANSKVEVIGAENFDKNETYLIVSNHQSIFDVTVINGYLGGFAGFIGKESIAKMPFARKWLTLDICGVIDRSSSRKAVETINKCANLLKKGVSQVIFPEGTRTEDGKVHEFKAGAFKLATKAKVKVLPIALIGPYDMLKKKSLKLRAHDVKMVIHPPISMGDMNTHEMAKLTQELISATVENHSFVA